VKIEKRRKQRPMATTCPSGIECGEKFNDSSKLATKIILSWETSNGLDEHYVLCSFTSAFYIWMGGLGSTNEAHTQTRMLKSFHTFIHTIVSRSDFRLLHFFKLLGKGIVHEGV